MTEITIGGKKLILEYTLAAYEMVEKDEELESADKFAEHMTGKGWIRRLAKYVAILNNAHLLKEGQKPTMTADWVMNNTRPGEVINKLDIKLAVAQEIFNGLLLESANDSDDEVDVVKEEIEKKEDAGQS